MLAEENNDFSLEKSFTNVSNEGKSNYVNFSISSELCFGLAQYVWAGLKRVCWALPI